MSKCPECGNEIKGELDEKIFEDYNMCQKCLREYECENNNPD